MQSRDALKYSLFVSLIFLSMASQGASANNAVATTSASTTQNTHPTQSQSIQDATEGMSLLGVSLQLMQIPFAMLGGDATKAQELTQTALTDVNKVLEKNPDSPMGLSLRGHLKNITKDKSGTDDFQRVVAVTTQRIDANPDYIENYKMRADAQKELGNKDAARADLTHALKLAKDSKEIAKIQEKLNELSK